MSYYSNPTANAAMGAVDREIRMMRKRAKQLRQRRRMGLLTPAELAQARRQFTGIYSRFLREALMTDAPKTLPPELEEAPAEQIS